MTPIINKVMVSKVKKMILLFDVDGTLTPSRQVYKRLHELDNYGGYEQVSDNAD